MKTRGFTLIELMIVLAILGILAAIIVPAINGWSDKSNGQPAPHENAQVVRDQPAAGSALNCAKVSQSAEGAVHKCADGTVLLVK